MVLNIGSNTPKSMCFQACNEDASNPIITCSVILGILALWLCYFAFEMTADKNPFLVEIHIWQVSKDTRLLVLNQKRVWFPDWKIKIPSPLSLSKRQQVRQGEGMGYFLLQILQLLCQLHD